MLSFFLLAESKLMSTYKHLSYEQRCHIYQLNKIDWEVKDIAIELGVHKSTIYRELNRNSGDRGYRHKQAQQKAEERKSAARKALKMTQELIGLIETKIREEWSPEQISGWLLEENEILISHERIYQHIWEDKKTGGDLYKHLRRRAKKYQPRGSSGKTSRGQIKNQVSIEERPDIVEEKGRFGDLEIDTMIGRNHQGALVTVVERATLYTTIALVSHKTAEKVTNATIRLLKPFKGYLQSITADNGKEFADHETISMQLNVDFYFAHPYCSWERGLNENTNGLIRQYFPKDTDFRSLTEREINQVMEKLNNRPRKSLGFKTPKELFFGNLKAAA
jgi:IS30 family transposase